MKKLIIKPFDINLANDILNGTVNGEITVVGGGYMVEKIEIAEYISSQPKERTDAIIRRYGYDKKMPLLVFFTNPRGIPYRYSMKGEITAFGERSMMDLIIRIEEEISQKTEEAKAKTIGLSSREYAQQIYT